MTSPRLHITRFAVWMNPIFDESMAADDSVTLEIAPTDDTEAAWAALQRAHIYQITAAKDELVGFHAQQALIDRCPNLLAVSSVGAGYDTVDVDACTRAGIAVVSQLGGNAHAVAEMAIGLMLAVSRRIAESDRKLRTQRGFSREALMGSDIGGKVLGIAGIGFTGTRTAELAKAFGMRVLAFDPLLAPEEIRRRGAEPVDLDTLLRSSDIVSLHCPRNKDTLNLLDAKRFASMKKGAIFVTTARGGIHDEHALAEVLTSGHLAGAGLDVWKQEPPPLDHPLLAPDNVVATYHTAGVSHEGRRNVTRMAAQQVLQLVRGERPPHLINPEVWDVFQERRRKALRALQAS
ncbi:hydroxyacid dehydrogenase [Piscinibacter koreensis]|uniref:Hydroxyacid dehydrogenase n=1 Tax=Piscinibacter koreensis TaxID=2742824 RepID=A0A7Y6TV32_9BURK|nr:hydroxyacid dehydrogenase [Schlegelella koreensis]NUZ04669.1 hydroxyacid dehydrogenase [Schlegelella koreensis]